MFKIESEKYKLIEWKYKDKIKSANLLYTFSLYCFEHKRGLKYVDDNKKMSRTKITQLLGCKAHVNFLLEAKEVIQEDDNKIIVNYKKTKSEDEHDHKLDFQKVQEKINMKHISQEINKFAGDSCIKTVKKYISDNELNTEVKYHKIYHILSKKGKKFKEHPLKLSLIN